MAHSVTPWQILKFGQLYRVRLASANFEFALLLRRMPKSILLSGRSLR